MITSKNTNGNHVLRLERGDLLIEGLLGYCKSNNLFSGWVQAIGGAEWAEVGFYDLEKQVYNWQRINEFLEITSLSGNVSKMDDEIILHLHVTLANSKNQVFGGHVKELCVGGTVEILVLQSEKDFELKRHFDKVTGLNVLDL